jgi:SNF2 family DNA or RNA helicase
MKVNLEIKDGLFMVRLPFNREHISLLKNSGLNWNPNTKAWICRAESFPALCLSQVFSELKDQLKLYLPETSCNNHIPSSYLMSHQKDASLIASNNPRFGFFDDTGTGKTLSGIELVKQKRVKTLVVCPLSIITNAWINDINKFSPELKVINLWEYNKNKKNKIPEHQIALINFEQFRTNYTKLKNYKMLLVDESSRIKDHKSQITKAMIKYVNNIPYVYLFSGTPAPNNEMEYWSQLRVIDPLLLGANFYEFRNKYFYSPDTYGYKWVMQPGKREEFLNKLSQKTRVVRKEDCLSLPERTFNIRSVSLSRQEMEAYREMEREMLLEIEDHTITATNAAVKIMKLRQGTSGFFYSEKRVFQTGRSKLDALLELLEEIGNHQVIIWTHFHVEADLVEKELSNNCIRIDGTVSGQTQKDDLLKNFINRNTRYLISHPASLGHGVTLTNCSYAIYFSMSHSYELAYQSQDRIYRKGQRNACTYYYLVVPKTIDEAIIKAIQKKESAALAVFNFIRRKEMIE